MILATLSEVRKVSDVTASEGGNVSPHTDSGESSRVSYRFPPVTEVVAAVRFAELPVPVVIQLGDWWGSAVAQDFPSISEQPPYDPPIEQFDRTLRRDIGFNFQLESLPPRRRLWFSSPNGTELIQLQSNWLACNWRKTSPTEVYGRWPARRESFARWLKSLIDWCKSRGVDLVFEQCEVTYINHIEPIDGVWRTHGDVGNLIEPLRGASTLPGVELERTVWQAQYRIPGQSVRLNVALQPVNRVENDMPAYQLELTARGNPAANTAEGVLATLDAGRRSIVNSFAAMTSAGAQEKWGRQ
jgi:uncharacterized protein (TIGR04255 family)